MHFNISTIGNNISKHASANIQTNVQSIYYYY